LSSLSGSSVLGILSCFGLVCGLLGNGSRSTISYTVTAGTSCGEVESTKSVSDIYAPVSGTVVNRNDGVETAPETINGDPYGAGWLVDVTVSDATAAVAALLDAAGYAAHAGE